jgi:protoheme IX farnesyltransferase
MTAPEPILAALDAPVVPRRFAGSTALSDYWALTKPEVNFLIAITTAAAFWIGSPAALSQFPWLLLLHTILGTVLVASGAGTLNQWMERQFDRMMRRTARRPIAAGRIEPIRARIFGTLLSLSGVLDLALAVRPSASLLALATLGLYLFLYTPLKRRTPLCTLVGAFPGAMPVLIGYIAAAGQLSPPAWLLFAILFFWQFPHFMAIAWMYREDYARAGYMVLPSGELRNRFVNWLTILPALALLPVGRIPTITGATGLFYSVATLVLGAIFLYYGASFAFHRSNVSARRLLAASIIYLPAVFVLISLNKK